ncbi:MAG: hypothetical protein J5744_00995 [Oscillospiraceae bacterium]|nr:hypothetical protein [Oscillospiraceae bacterium]
MTGKVTRMIMAAALTFSILSLFGCGFGKKYRVYAAPGIEIKRDSYREGETVTVRTHTVMDEIIDIYIDGEIAVSSTESNDEWIVVKFTMPAHDVTVELGSVNISVDPGSGYQVLISAFDMTTGTEMFQPYNELVLLRKADGSLEMRNVLHEEDSTSYTSYEVPDTAYEEILGVILGEGMDRWLEEGEEDPIDGAYWSCSFRQDGDMTTVTSDDPMIGDGHRSFGKVWNAMLSMINSGREITDSD